MSDVVRRLTQGERSARTRDKLIAAAVEALSRYGYAAASTTLVAEIADVSRGAMLHQFPTKTDLMVAVTRASFETDLAAYRRELGKTQDPREKLIALLDTAWVQFRSASGIAATEIWIATRSDPELAEAVLPIHREQIASTQDAQAVLLNAAGFRDRESSDALLMMNVAALRGLAFEHALGASEALLESAFSALRRRFIDDIDAAAAQSAL